MSRPSCRCWSLGHHANEAGIVTLTYDELCRATHLSRTKVAAGLNVLEGANIIARKGLERSHYAITEYASKPWGKIPMKGLYVHGGVAAFREFHLRQRTELDALKLYFPDGRPPEQRNQHRKYELRHDLGILGD